MKTLNFCIAILAASLVLATSGCKEQRDEEKGEHAVGTGGEGEGGEHGAKARGRGEDREHAAEHGDEGEEAGFRLGVNETYNEVRNGVRMVLAYDSTDGMFVGTVENVTEAMILRVRVEVHLSDGTEVGPTEPGDLRPGEARSVSLSAEGRSFAWWKAHAESGAGE